VRNGAETVYARFRERIGGEKGEKLCSRAVLRIRKNEGTTIVDRMPSGGNFDLSPPQKGNGG